MVSRKPAEYTNGDLSDERLIAVACFFRDERGETINLHDDEKDTLLSLGVRCYERCKKGLINKAKEGFWNWLKIIDETGRFTFCIGNTPVRFCRENDLEQLSLKRFIQSDKLNQMDLFGQSQDITKQKIKHWYIILDTLSYHAADRVYCVGYSEPNQLVCQWKIPIDDVPPTPLYKVDTDKLPSAHPILTAMPKLKKGQKRQNK